MSIHVIARQIASTAIVLGLAAPHALAQSSRIPLPPVPVNLAVPEGHKLFLAGYAIGTQNYTCLPTATAVAWSFTGPQATVFRVVNDEVRQQLTTHFLSVNPVESVPRPTWQHSRDSSRVWGRAAAASTDPAFVEHGAIAWLLLEATGAELGPTGGDALAETSFIQRLNTSGGVAPTTGCSLPEHVGAAAFSAVLDRLLLLQACRSTDSALQVHQRVTVH